MKLNLLIKNPGRYPIKRKRLFDVINKTLVEVDRFEAMQAVEVSLLIVNKPQMAEYNLKYHETPGPTDVLSFPFTDPESQVSEAPFINPPGTGIVLGDLIVCYPIAREIAAKEGKTVDETVDFYVDHGLHHLLGIHHD